MIAVYVFVATAGKWSTWPLYWGFYDHLADAFRSGQLHLLFQPNPLLLAQADPYDPQHRSLWAWDYSVACPGRADPVREKLLAESSAHGMG